MSLFEVPDRVRGAWPAAARDFDFLQGDWIIHHRRLKERLMGSTEWVEFETPHVMQAILGGLGNIDQCRTAGEPFFEGVSLRLFDIADNLWRIYWIDTTGARLFPPVVGSFDGPIGTVGGEDTHEGRPVLVTFQCRQASLASGIFGRRRSVLGNQLAYVLSPSGYRVAGVDDVPVGRRHRSSRTHTGGVSRPARRSARSLDCRKRRPRHLQSVR
jgi:hypothetical protein